MAFVTMWFANIANVNPGVVTVIWALGPLYMALAEWWSLGTKLQQHHWIGVFLIIICAILIALSGIFLPKALADLEASSGVYVLPSWAPVVMAIVTPVWFTTSGILVKHMTG